MSSQLVGGGAGGEGAGAAVTAAGGGEAGGAGDDFGAVAQPASSSADAPPAIHRPKLMPVSLASPAPRANRGEGSQPPRARGPAAFMRYSKPPAYAVPHA
jgi:hypothetical protein